MIVSESGKQVCMICISAPKAFHYGNERIVSIATSCIAYPTSADHILGQYVLGVRIWIRQLCVGGNYASTEPNLVTPCDPEASLSKSTFSRICLNKVWMHYLCSISYLLWILLSAVEYLATTSNFFVGRTYVQKRTVSAIIITE